MPDCGAELPLLREEDRLLPLPPDGLDEEDLEDEGLEDEDLEDEDLDEEGLDEEELLPDVLEDDLWGCFFVAILVTSNNKSFFLLGKNPVYK